MTRADAEEQLRALAGVAVWNLAAPAVIRPHRDGWLIFMRAQLRLVRDPRGGGGRAARRPPRQRHPDRTALTKTGAQRGFRFRRQGKRPEDQHPAPAARAAAKPAR